MSAAEVVVLGDLMVDVVVTPEGPIEYGSDTASAVRSVGGGAAANTACWLASIGRAVRLVAAVGDDSLGRAAIAELADGGVAFAGSTVADRPTGTCVVLVDQSGERTMLPDRGANDRLPPPAVEAALRAGAAWLHVSGYALLGEGSRPGAMAAIEVATQRSIPWSVDASSAAPLRAVGPERFLDWVGGCRILFANDDELEALGGTEPILAHAAELVAKHGPAGASWTDGTTTVTRPAVAGVRLVDTVGAGDAFDAGYLDALLSGAAPPEALEAGARVAARAISRLGARP